MLIGERYEVLKPIGEGGMGVVYVARDRVLERLVAVKVLHEQFGNDQAFVTRFATEAKIVAQLSSNPHVITIYDVGTLTTGAPYLVMEYLEGRALRDVMKVTRSPSRTWVIDIGSHIAAALLDAHTKGVVHRDLKPENVFYLEVHTLPFLVKVLDFGIATSPAVALSPEVAAQNQQIVGTLPYMAPETFQGRSQPASDIYALGLILYEVCTGRRPYRASTAAEFVWAHVHEEPAPLPLAEGGGSAQWPLSFGELVRRMLAKEPARRPTAQEALRALGAIEYEIDARRHRTEGEEGAVSLPSDEGQGAAPAGEPGEAVPMLATTEPLHLAATKKLFRDE